MVRPGTTGQLRDPHSHVRNLARLVEVSLTLNSTFNVVELLQYILKSAAEILACETASLMIYDEERGELHFTAAAEDQESLAKIPVPLEGSIAGVIFTEPPVLTATFVIFIGNAGIRNGPSWGQFITNK